MQQHEKTLKQDSIKSASQPKFVSKIEILSLTSSAMKLKQLSTEDQVIHAEIIICLDIIDFNIPFSPADSNSEKYVAVFPDTTIAKSFQQKAKKVKHNLVLPYIWNNVLEKSFWIFLFHSVLIKAQHHN